MGTKGGNFQDGARGGSVATVKKTQARPHSRRANSGLSSIVSLAKRVDAATNQVQRRYMPAEDRPYGADGDRRDPKKGERVVVPLSGRRDETAPDHQGYGQDAIYDDSAEGWAPSARAIWRGSQILAAGLFVAWLIAWPAGTTLADSNVTGTFSLRLGYSPTLFLLALTTSGLVLGAGYALAAGVRLEAAAQRLTRSITAGAWSPGSHQSSAARAQVSALNEEIDRALHRLAEAESLIRQQVKAIDSAGAAIEKGAVKSTEKLEKEREALMSLAEELNQEADAFADKIAERSKLSSNEQEALEQRLEEKERELDTQLRRLEAVSEKSLERYEHLASLMENRSDTLDAASAEANARQTALASKIEQNTQRLEAAQSQLAEQSARLEQLMKDQRKRADRLAKTVTEQAQKLAPRAPELTPTGAERRKTPWRDILATVEEAIPARPPMREPATPADTTPTPAPAAPRARDKVDPMDRLIARIQNFSLVMRTQLYGTPAHEDLDRFDQGERQLFARDLTTRDAGELRRRLADELENNAVFEQRVQEFLQDFDTILEPLSSEEGGESAIETYLASPLGRLYVLTGSVVGHFA